MEKSIELEQKNIAYTLRVSNRARRLRLAVYSGGGLVVVAPRNMTFEMVERFIMEKSHWVIKSIERLSKYAVAIPRPRYTKAHFLQYKTIAHKFAEEKIVYFNVHYNFQYTKIVIRNQKTRWGSCSKKGNINFNYKIALLPEKLANYIIVHELCHLGEFNHSKNFWKLVAETIPDYKERRTELKRDFRI